MESLKKSVIFIGIFLSIIFLFLLLILISISSSFTMLSENRGNIYRLTEIIPGTNETKSNFVVMNRILDKEQYISFFDSDDHYIIVSHITGSRWECSGSCYCRDNQRRNLLASTTLKQGIKMLITAASFLLATRIATDYIRNQCTKHYSEKENIFSNPNAKPCTPEEIDAILDECEEEVPEDKIEHRVYQCIGYCIDEENLIEEKFDYPANFECGTHEQAGEVKIEVPVGIIELHPDVYSIYTAKLMFEKEYMQNYCKEIGFLIMSDDKLIHLCRTDPTRDNIICERKV